MNEKRNEQTTETQTGRTPAGVPPTPAAAGQTPPSPPPYGAAGEAFNGWLNRQVGLLPSPTLRLGTKRARIVRLLPDGRLEVEVETEALEPERQFVAFEGQHLDQLVRKIAALGGDARPHVVASVRSDIISSTTEHFAQCLCRFREPALPEGVVCPPPGAAQRPRNQRLTFSLLMK